MLDLASPLIDPTGFDTSLVRYFAEHRTAWLTAAMRYLTWMGSTVVLVPLIVVVGALVRRRTGSWVAMAQLAASLAGAVALHRVIKPIVGRPRPRIGELVSTASGYAFPSGHATQVAAVAVALAIIWCGATEAWSRKVIIWTSAALVCLVVGFSRIYLGVHWPTDVVAGYALGALWASMSGLVINRRRHLKKPN